MENPYEAPQSDPQIEPNFFCEACHEPQYAKPRRTFLGFPRVECPGCYSEMVFRLPAPAVIFYVILGVLGLLGLTATIGGNAPCAAYGFVALFLGIPVVAVVINNGIPPRGRVVHDNKSS